MRALFQGHEDCLRGPSGGFTSDIQPDPMHVKLFTSTINYWPYDFLSDLHAITVPCFENLFISCSSVVLFDGILQWSDSKPIKLPQPVSSPPGHDCWCKAWRSMFLSPSRVGLLRNLGIWKDEGQRLLVCFFREKETWHNISTSLGKECFIFSFSFFVSCNVEGIKNKEENRKFCCKIEFCWAQ